MMTKKDWLILCLLGVIGVFTVYGYFYLQEQKTLSGALNDIREEHGQKSVMIDLLTGNMKMYYTYNDRPLSDFDVITPEKQTVRFSSLLGEECKVVFKYASTNCPSCIDAELDRIVNLARHLRKDQLIILGEYANRRQFLASMKGRALDFPVYQVEANVFGDLLEKENVPFFFVTDRNMRLSDLFVPMKELPDFSELYYRIILKKYFDF